MFVSHILDEDEKFPVQGGLDEDPQEASIKDLKTTSMLRASGYYIFITEDGQYLWVLAEWPRRWVIYEKV